MYSNAETLDIVYVDIAGDSISKTLYSDCWIFQAVISSYPYLFSRYLLTVKLNNMFLR